MTEKKIKQWKEFNLTEQIQNNLYNELKKINVNQESATSSRKTLLELTKQYKTLSDAEKHEHLGKLLKAYQEEMDALSSRSLNAEKCFSNLYKALETLPDPASLTESLAAELSMVESKNKGLESEKERMALEYARLKQDTQELRDQQFKLRTLEEKLAEYDAAARISHDEQAELADLRRQLEIAVSAETLLRSE